MAAHRSFFIWRKIVLRSVHLFLVLFVSSSLFIKDTGELGIDTEILASHTTLTAICRATQRTRIRSICIRIFVYAVCLRIHIVLFSNVSQ
jgi:hypothetical protein